MDSNQYITLFKSAPLPIAVYAHIIDFGGKYRIRTYGTFRFNGLANRPIKPLWQLPTNAGKPHECKPGSLTLLAHASTAWSPPLYAPIRFYLLSPLHFGRQAVSPTPGNVTRRYRFCILPRLQLPRCSYSTTQGVALGRWLPHRASPHFPIGNILAHRVAARSSGRDPEYGAIGRIRTHGPFGLLFSRQVSSTTRPRLHDSPPLIGGTTGGRLWRVICKSPYALAYSHQKGDAKSMAGAPGGARTHGPQIKNLLLYQLSYGNKKANLMMKPCAAFINSLRCNRYITMHFVCR